MYPSIQEEPNNSGSSASISAIEITTVPNSLAANLGLSSTLSAATNQIILLECFGHLADTSNTANVTAIPSQVLSALSSSTSV